MSRRARARRDRRPDDPRPRRPGLLLETAWSLRVAADTLGEAATGLSGISTPQGWSGAAAEEFRSAFPVQATRWADAAECHRTAAAAVEAHASELVAAQRATPPPRSGTRC